MEGSVNVAEGRWVAWDREEEGRERGLAGLPTAGGELQTGDPAVVCSKRAEKE